MTSLSKVIHETKDFALEVAKMEMVQEPFRSHIGYRLLNKRTQVVEREGMSEADAIRTLHASQEWLDKVLADPAGNSEPEPDFPPGLLAQLESEGNA